MVLSSAQQTKPESTAAEKQRWQNIINQRFTSQIQSSIRSRETCTALGWEWHESNKTCIPAVSTLSLDLTCAMLGGKMVSDICDFDAYTTSSTQSGAGWTQDLDYTDN